MILYTIAQVYDYKGGELYMSTNLSYDEASGEIYEEYQDLYIDFNKDTTKEEILVALNNFHVEENTYASCDGGGFCGEIYKQENNIMSTVKFDHFHDGIADVFLEIFKEE